MERFQNPGVDWAALSPVLVLIGGAAVVLVGTLFVPARAKKPFAALVAAACFVAAAVAAGILFAGDDEGRSIIGDAIRRDRLAEIGQVLVALAGLLTVGVSWNEPAPREEETGRPLERAQRERVGDYYALLLSAVAGMAFFVAAHNLMTLFLGLEWFSISLYVLTAIAVERLPSLEAGLKYLIVGSFGSAILLFGSALVYGATGALQFEEIAAGAAEGEPCARVYHEDSFFGGLSASSFRFGAPGD
jgi:NADH-quinone oxidoreductase subunit N